MTVERFGPYSVELSNTDKVLFPDGAITKGALIRYYGEISGVILPHLENRPLTLHRFPDGIGAKGFYQQKASEYFPNWIQTQMTPRAGDTGEPVEHVLCNNQATLVYLANQATIALHGWASRADALRRPDRLIFDLDPSGQGFGAVRQAARWVVELMEEIGLTPFAMTTGSRGLHVVAPLRPDADFDAVRELAKEMASHLADQHAGDLTVEQRKNKRHGRIYLDVMRNAYGQTSVMPYSVRALPGAPVATPVSLNELQDGRLDPRRWTLRNVFRRLGQKEDPWIDIQRHSASASHVRHAIAALRGTR